MRADIHDGPRSTPRSNWRPDTLMQDRNYRIDENLLQRTAGPYIGVTSRHQQQFDLGLLYPPKRTSRRSRGASAKGPNPESRHDATSGFKLVERSVLLVQLQRLRSRAARRQSTLGSCGRQGTTRSK